MEVEGPTDGAVAVGRGAAGMAAAGSKDMGAASAGAIGMEVEERAVAAAGTAGAGEKVQRHRAGKQAGMTSNQRKRLRKLRERGQDK